MWTRFLNNVAPMALAAALGLLPATAAELTLTYNDPVADASGSVDVTNMVLLFDPTTGNYKLTLTANAAQPFDERFRVNANLFNPSRLPASSFFTSVVNDYDLTTPKTKLILRGNHPALTAWAAGDVVSTNTAASGGMNPPGITAYRSSVLELPLTSPWKEDAIAFGNAGSATVAPQTAAGALQSVMDDVLDLRDRGVLNRMQAASLLTKLNSVLKAWNGHPQTVDCATLAAFIGEVKSLVAAGVLTQAQATILVQGAASASSSMGC